MTGLLAPSPTSLHPPWRNKPFSFYCHTIPGPLANLSFVEETIWEPRSLPFPDVCFFPSLSLSCLSLSISLFTSSVSCQLRFVTCGCMVRPEQNLSFLSLCPTMNQPIFLLKFKFRSFFEISERICEKRLVAIETFFRQLSHTYLPCLSSVDQIFGGYVHMYSMYVRTVKVKRTHPPFFFLKKKGRNYRFCMQ